MLPTGVDGHGHMDEFGMTSRRVAIGRDGGGNLCEKSRGLPGAVADVEPVIQIRAGAHFRQPPGSAANDDIAEQRGFVIHQPARLKP
jgi:hypothetical protein